MSIVGRSAYFLQVNLGGNTSYLIFEKNLSTYISIENKLPVKKTYLFNYRSEIKNYNVVESDKISKATKRC